MFESAYKILKNSKRNNTQSKRPMSTCMHHRKTIIKTILTCFFFTIIAPLPSHADENTTPVVQKTESLKAKEDYAHHFAQMVLAIVQDTKKNFEDRKGILRTAFSNSVDIDWIAKFVLGNGWARATEEQKEKYTALYRNFLTETYVANFAENPDKRIRDIKIFGVNETTETDFTVRTEMMLASMENLRVNYLVNDTEGHYKVRDIAIENISLITTHRSEFSSLANAKGIQGVIEELKNRLDKMKEKEKSFSQNSPLSH